jgi:hypothetical protein
MELVGEKAEEDRGALIKIHLAGLVQMVQTHKVAVGAVGAEIAEHLKASKKAGEPYSTMYVSLLNIQMAVHCAGITQGSGQLALMAAMGIEDVPLPASVEFNTEGATTQ